MTTLSVLDVVRRRAEEGTMPGQAVLWATTFEDLAGRELIDPARVLGRRPVLDLGFLFETVIARRKPLSAAGLARGTDGRRRPARGDPVRERPP